MLSRSVCQHCHLDCRASAGDVFAIERRRREANHRSRPWLRLAGAGLILAGALFAPAGGAGASTSPPLAAGFYGAVSVNGGTVPAGVAVTAWAAGRELARSAVRMVDGQAVYSLDVPG
ncbi:MAG: hypothetical protein HYV63_23170, partial [Candidatus Schekmanbacteria bacterium]|nr:hypothetical protein [Candidatus Schekmanbacteria bacterium]